MAAHGLTENHERGLLAGVQYAAKLIRECEEILAASDRPSPLNRYTGGLTPPQRRIAEDYLQRLHQQLLRFLDVAGVSRPAPRISAVHALANAMLFLENALEEMRGRYLRGYGAVSAEAERLLDGSVSEMQALVREIETFLTGASADVLRARLDALLDTDPMTADLKQLERIISEHGLVDLRASLSLIVDRALDRAFEVAVIGRVSSGKSSLLNALIGAQVLPTGILPVTAVPTRLRRGRSAAIHVTYAHGRTESYGVDRLGEFVTEAHNPGNEKRVARVLVDYPSALLPEGVTFEIRQRLGVAVGERPVSVMPSHAELLRAWVADDVKPLGAEAMARRREALARKVAVLRAQAAEMLEQQTTRCGRPLDAPDTAAIVSRLRDVSAALERTSREFSSCSERREAIVEATLAAASARLAEVLDGNQDSVESVRIELTRPAQHEAERVAHVLERLATDVHLVLSDAAAAAGAAYDSADVPGRRREVPLITLPPWSFPPKAPAWTRISAAVVRKWTATRLQEQWGPAIDRAVAAYLDVLKRWAADGLALLRDEFESHSRPLVAQLSPDTPPERHSAGQALIESDLRWLRRGGDPHGTPHCSPSRSIPHQE